MGSCNQCKERICIKEEKSISVVKKGERRDM